MCFWSFFFRTPAVNSVSDCFELTSCHEWDKDCNFKCRKYSPLCPWCLYSKRFLLHPQRLFSLLWHENPISVGWSGRNSEPWNPSAAKSAASAFLHSPGSRDNPWREKTKFSLLLRPAPMTNQETCLLLQSTAGQFSQSQLSKEPPRTVFLKPPLRVKLAEWVLLWEIQSAPRASRTSEIVHS